MNKPSKKKHVDTENRLTGYQREKGRRDKLGVWD